MLLRKTLLYLPAGLLGPLVQLATILVWTHWLAPAELGLYALVVALQELAHLGCLTWWSNYVLRYLEPREAPARARQDRIERRVLALSVLVQSVLVPLLVLVFVDRQAAIGLLAAIALASGVRSAVTHWSVRARAEQRIGLYGIATTLGHALSLLFGLAFMIWLGPGPMPVFVGMALAYLVTVFVVGPRLGLATGALDLDRAVVLHALRYGALTTLGSALAWVSIQSVTFTTEFVLGTASVGMLAVGWNLGQRLATQLGLLTTNAVLPLAIARSREHGLAAGLAQMAQGASLLLALGIPALAGVSLLAEPLANLLTAAPYRETTAQVLPLALAAGLLRALRHNVFDEAFQLAERPDLMSALDAAEAAATLLLCLAGLAVLGLIGAVAGAALASGLATLASLAVTATRFGFRPFNRQTLSILLATATMSAVLALLPPPQGAAAVAAAIGLGIALYAATLAALEHRRLRELLVSLPSFGGRATEPETQP